MKTVEDAVRDLKGVWPSREDRCSSLYVYKDGDYHALDPQWHDDYTGVTFVCSREEFDECKTKLEGKSMKLIDILARELEEWPEGAVCAVQNKRIGTIALLPSMPCASIFGGSQLSPDVHGDWWHEKPDGHKYCGYIGSVRYFSACLADDHATAIITREQWEEARREMWESLDWRRIGSNLSYHPEDVAFKKPEWRGPQDGLPPVGAVCETYLTNMPEGDRNHAIIRVTYSHEDVVCGEIIDSESDYMRDKGKVIAKETDSNVFAYVKSDRDRWIEQSCEAVETEAPDININIYCSYAIRKTIEVIYDAGLGKLAEEE